MKPARLLPAARRDLDGIWSYSVERWGRDQAIRYLLALADAWQAIADGTWQGRPMDAARQGYRALATGSHLICYRQAKDGAIEVVRILHERMDVPNRLGRAPRSR